MKVEINKMKVLQINCVYPTGSTGKIVRDIHLRLLENNYGSIVLFGRGSNIRGIDIIKASPELVMKVQSLWSRITGYVHGGCWISTLRIMRYISKIGPDVVHLHCINGYMVSIYGLLLFLSKRRIKTVVTLHAEFMYTGGCSYTVDCTQYITECCANGLACPEYNRLRPSSWFFDRVNREWKLMQRAFSSFHKSDIVVCAVSDWVKDKAVLSPFIKSLSVVTVLNGIDTQVFRYVGDCAMLIRKHKLEGKMVILHVTPDFGDPRKGGHYVLELAKRFLHREDVRFIVVGPMDQKLDVSENVVIAGRTSNQEELAAYYSIANLTVLTSLRETFSMIVAESLSCGTPVVGFKSGAPESIALEGFSSFVDYGDMEQLENAVKAQLCLTTDKLSLSGMAREKYSADNMYSDYVRVYETLVEEGGDYNG